MSFNGHSSARWDVLKTLDQNSLVMDQTKYVRANPAIAQYAFSGCYANDAPNSGHCRPQIDSDQGWSSNVQNAGWMSIDLKSSVTVAGVVTQGRNSNCGCNQVTFFCMGFGVEV